MYRLWSTEFNEKAISKANPSNPVVAHFVLTGFSSNDNKTLLILKRLKFTPSMELLEPYVVKTEVAHKNAMENMLAIPGGHRHAPD